MTAVIGAVLALALAGCHSTSNAGGGSGTTAWPQSPFNTQHDQMAKAVENDPFPDANQPLRPLSPNQQQ